MTRKFTFLMTAMALILAIMGPRNVAWGQRGEKSIEINTTNSGVTGSYADKTFDVENITFGFTQWMKNNNIQAKKSTTNSLYNDDAIPGIIKSITFVQTQTARAIKVYGGTSSKPTTEITAPETAATMTFDFSGKEYTYFSMTTPGNACYFDKITINYEEGTPSTDPVINADDVELAYDATSGEIPYSITNPISSTTLSAETNDTWISNITVNASNVTFTTTENETSSQRVGTITLSYTGATSKDVTVTQAAAPQEGVLFYESFDTNDGTGGNDDSWSGSIASNDLKSDNEGWTFVKGNGANKCAKFGTGSAKGYAETPAISFSGNATLTFKAAAWNGSSEGTTLNISATNATLSQASVTLVKGAWTEYSIDITNVTNSTQITFEANNASNNRFFLDEVKVLEAEAPSVATPTFTPGAGTYTEAKNVTITCATEDASIYYTLDGSTPTNASTLYTSAIAVSETTTVKAIAYVGEESSNVATAVYEIITIPTYTSLAELIAAGEPTATGVLVNVTLTDEEITRIFTTTQGYRNGIFLQSGEQEIEIYCYNVPTEWVVGGTVSGTLNNCTWKLYGNIWELCPENWNELTYTAPSTEFHLIEIDDTITNGSVSASAEEAQVGTIITLTVTPAENYSLDEIGVLGNTSEPELTKVNVNTYTFEMPDEDVIVFASFVENDTYTITYYYNGEKYTENLIYEGAIGTLETPDDEFLPEGFSFVGWSTSMASTTAITESYNVTANTDLFAIFARVEGGTTGSGNYEKVTSALTDWSGDYLIVYEGDDDHDAVAFDGSLETLDAVENGINVSIENGIIAANEELVNSEFTIAAIVEGYSIMNKSGDFIGRTSSGNGLNTSTTAIKNSLEISGNAMSISSGGCTLQYNYASNQLRFRYYTSSNQQPIQLYKKSAGTSGVTHYYTRVYDENTELSSLTVSGPSIVLSGYTLTVTGTMTNTNAANLVIEDGGQIIRSDEGTVNATFKKHIEGYTANQDNYYLIAAPIANASIEGLTTNSYDLYSYDEPTHYWFNQEGTNTFSSLSLGQGYLYANSTTGDVTISGTISNNQNPTIDVTASSDNLTGFNLVGNPFSYNLSISDMAMMDDDTEIYDITSIYQISGTAVVASQNTSVAPCEGFFIQAPVAGELYFNAGSSRSEKSSVSDLKVEVKESTRSAQLLDRAYVNFSESRPMNKFYLNENSTRLYIPQNGKDYAVVMANAANGEMPVNFKAEKNGTYTITVSTENVEANYLHLIDNLTGADIDLLTTDSYTFDATTRDYASRFKLVFGVNNSNAEVNGNSFAYISNGELIISNEGRATLQVIDMTGRIVSSQEIEGEGRISTEGMTAGVYVLNLNGTTQKIVVR